MTSPWRVLCRLLSSRVRDLEEQLRIEKRACEVHLDARAKSAGDAKRLTTECADWKAQVVALNEEARIRHAQVCKLRREVATLAADLDRSRDVAAGQAADLAEARRELARLRPKGADPITAPRADADEVARLTADLDRTKRALAAAHNLLAAHEGRQVQGSVVGHG